MIAEKITKLIGNTPLLKLNNYMEAFGVKANLIAKLEYLNPAGSSKDRIAYGMVIEAERRDALKKGSTIIEPTSGNTGIGLAMVGASRGYKVILTMPDSMSLERRKLLEAYGAKLVLTPGRDGMQRAVEKAHELASQIKDSFIPSQFTNHINPLVHYYATGHEIWRDTDGEIDAFVAGVGSGGTISGAGKYLRERNSDIEIFAVEPEESPVLNGWAPASHKIQGIGANFVPKNFDRSVVTEIIDINAKDAFNTCRDLVRCEGLLVGISSGAALTAAVKIAARQEYLNKTIVVLLPDGGERYLSAEEYIK